MPWMVVSCFMRANRHTKVAGQLSFSLPDEPAGTFPQDRFPNNYGGATAGSVIEADLRGSRNQLLITGFTSLEKIVSYLASFYGSNAEFHCVRLLLGHEPLATGGRAWHSKDFEFSQAITDYWLDLRKTDNTSPDES